MAAVSKYARPMSELRKDWSIALAELLEEEEPGPLGTPSLLGRGTGCFIVDGDDVPYIYPPICLPKAIAHTWAEAAWILKYIDKYTDVPGLKLVNFGDLDLAPYKPGLALVVNGPFLDWKLFTEQLRTLPCNKYLTGGCLGELAEHSFLFNEASNRSWGYWEYHPFQIKGTRYPNLKHVLSSYEIHLSEVDSVYDLLFWIRQLAGKNTEAYGYTSSSDLVSAFDCIFGDFTKLPHTFDPQSYFAAFEQKTRPQTTRIPISPKLRHQVFERDGFRCCDCGASPQEEDVRLEVDHKIPLSRGGSNDIDNLRTLCRPCNIGKAARLIDYPDGHL